MFEIFGFGKKTKEENIKANEAPVSETEEPAVQEEPVPETLDAEEIRLNEEELQQEAEAQYETQETLLLQKQREPSEKPAQSQSAPEKTVPEKDKKKTCCVSARP